MEDSGLSTSARGGVRSLVFRILTAASDFMVVLVTARGFGAEGRGVYTLTSLAVTSIVILVGGPQLPMRSEVGRNRVPLGTLHTACVVLSGLTLVAGLIVAPALLVLFPDSRIPVYAALAAPLFMLVQLQISLYQAQGDVRRMHYVGLAQSAVSLAALTFVAVVATGEIATAMLVWACVQVIVPFVTLRAEARQAGFSREGLRPLLRRLVRRGIPVSIANGLGLVGYRVNLIVVAALLTVADVGRFSVAIVAGEVLFVISRALLTGAYAPMISSDVGESVRVTVRMLRHALALLIPLGLLLAAVAAVLAAPVLGDEFADVWLLVALLVPGFLGICANEVLANFFIVRLERTRELLWATSAGALANIVLGVAFVSWVGLPGAAIATSVSYIGAALYLLVRFHRAGGPRKVRDYTPGHAELADYKRLLSAGRGALLARLAGVRRKP